MSRQAEGPGPVEGTGKSEIFDWESNPWREPNPFNEVGWLTWCHAVHEVENPQHAMIVADDADAAAKAW